MTLAAASYSLLTIPNSLCLKNGRQSSRLAAALSLGFLKGTAILRKLLLQ
jgi:hypothetical protein